MFLLAFSITRLAEDYKVNLNANVDEEAGFTGNERGFVAERH